MLDDDDDDDDDHGYDSYDVAATAKDNKIITNIVMRWSLLICTLQSIRKYFWRIEDQWFTGPLLSIQQARVGKKDLYPIRVWVAQRGSSFQIKIMYDYLRPKETKTSSKPLWILLKHLPG